jgi:GxxExxY protein
MFSMWDEVGGWWRWCKGFGGNIYRFEGERVGRRGCGGMGICGCGYAGIGGASVVAPARGGCRPRVRSSFLHFIHGERGRATKGHGESLLLRHRELTERIIGLAIEVHRHSGPELLESFYAAALCRALERAAIRVRRAVGIPALYQGEALPLGFRAYTLADEIVILEIKAVAALLPVHDQQLQTYPRMSGLRWACCSISTRFA